MDRIINQHPDPQGEREKFVMAFNDTIGQSFVGVVAKALDDNYRRYNH